MSEKGFSIIEVILVIGIIAFMVAGLMAAGNGMAENSRALKLVKDMDTISAAAESYFWTMGSFPSAIGALMGQYLPGGFSGINPWGYPYEIQNTGSMITVSSVLPSGLKPDLEGLQVVHSVSENQDTMSVTRVRYLEIIEEAILEKRTLYGE